MQFITTRGEGQPVSAARAICLGRAGDGCLFVPEQFPSVDLHQALAQPDYPALAAFILEKYLTDYDPDFLRQTVRQVYGGVKIAFPGDGVLSPSIVRRNTEFLQRQLQGKGRPVRPGGIAFRNKRPERRQLATRSGEFGDRAAFCLR